MRGPTTIGQTFAQTVRRPVVPRRLLRRATCASRKRFGAALALLEAGESEALIFTKVDRASRCTEDFARLLRLSEEQYYDDDRRYR
jgi:hypothetical protein